MTRLDPLHVLIMFYGVALFAVFVILIWIALS